MKKILILWMSIFYGFAFGQESLNKKDSHFVRMCADHTLLEIKLAQTNAASQDVKNLASDMRQDKAKQTCKAIKK